MSKFFWPLLGVIALSGVFTLALLGFAAVVGIGTLAHTVGAIFVVPLIALAAFAVLGIFLYAMAFRTGLGN